MKVETELGIEDQPLYTHPTLVTGLSDLCTAFSRRERRAVVYCTRHSSSNSSLYCRACTEHSNYT